MEENVIVNIISEGYHDLYGRRPGSVTALPRSGSDRRYYRINEGQSPLIAAYNPNEEENEAFIGFTRHFFSKSLPVPELYGYYPGRFVYFLQDLGNENLYTWLHNRDFISPFDDESLALYRKIFDKLILFQTEGIEGLNLDLCYPHRSFDRQSMMWDMNYFKYMLLKLLAVPFNERRLEDDFEHLADFLLEAGQDYFLYRDFQTANVMVMDGNPWFIDYQGGRKGAPQYDVASLLYDAKIPMTDEDRESLLDYYIVRFCERTGEDPGKFRGYYSAFSIIRVMQALGAFGFRGLYEKKPTFTESIVPGVELLNRLTVKAAAHIRLDELYRVAEAIPETSVFVSLKRQRHL